MRIERSGSSSLERRRMGSLLPVTNSRAAAAVANPISGQQHSKKTHLRRLAQLSMGLVLGLVDGSQAFAGVTRSVAAVGSVPAISSDSTTESRLKQQVT